jgi:hypothetical protein
VEVSLLIAVIFELEVQRLRRGVCAVDFPGIERRNQRDFEVAVCWGRVLVELDAGDGVGLESWEGVGGEQTADDHEDDQKWNDPEIADEEKKGLLPGAGESPPGAGTADADLLLSLFFEGFGPVFARLCRRVRCCWLFRRGWRNSGHLGGRVKIFAFEGKLFSQAGPRRRAGLGAHGWLRERQLPEGAAARHLLTIGQMAGPEVGGQALRVAVFQMARKAR